MSKNNSNGGLNLDDFNIENVFDPNYVPSDVEPTEPAETTEVEPAEPAPTDKVVVTPKKDLVPNVPDDDDEPEVDPDEMPSPDGNEIDFKPFYNLFHEKLGWEVSEDEMPENSMEGLIDYMNNIVESASKPQYANELSEKFDKFLANGGDPEKFINTMFKSKDYTTFEIKSDEDKKQVLKDLLVKSNPDKDTEWINKKINRYEDSGVLDEEAEDALEVLRTWDKQAKDNIVASQEAAKKAEAEEYKNQLVNLKSKLMSTKEIAKMPVSQKEMESFYTFLAVPEKDGKTKYQKVTTENEEAAIITAYLAYKNFDFSNMKASVRTDVVKDLKKSLSQFSSSNTGLTSKTSIPATSNKADYNAFNLNL